MLVHCAGLQCLFQAFERIGNLHVRIEGIRMGSRFRLEDVRVVQLSNMRPKARVHHAEDRHPKLLALAIVFLQVIEVGIAGIYLNTVRQSLQHWRLDVESARAVPLDPAALLIDLEIEIVMPRCDRCP